jgi:hypothetical protein
LKNDKEFILKAIKEKSGIILECAGDTMKKDKEDVIEAVKNLSSSFEAASVKMNTFDKFDHEFMNERDFVLKIVQLNGILLERASKELQDDGEIYIILSGFGIVNIGIYYFSFNLSTLVFIISPLIWDILMIPFLPLLVVIGDVFALGAMGEFEEISTKQMFQKNLK